MRRAPYVIGGTAAGLALVLSFHTSGPSLVSLSTGGTTSTSRPVGSPTTAAASPAAGAPPTTAARSAGSPGSTPAPTAASTPAPGVVSRSTPTTATSSPTTSLRPTTSTTSGTRSASGQTVYYQYGVLQLRVTVTNSRITDITAVVDEASDRRSADINDQAIPQLRDQALQAQSAGIDGVSGATYTSQAYVQSLQSALDQLGWKG